MYVSGGKMKAYSQWLNSLIEDLNYDTLIEEPWSVEFIDAEGNHQVMGNSRKKTKTGYLGCIFSR